MNRLDTALAAACLCLCAVAQANPLDAERAARFKALTSELRCLVCQNQTIADSNAALAVDLRNEVQRMLNEGATDAAIVDYMVARYGDFVLYEPPFKASTALLWVGPFVLLALALVAVAVMARRRRNAAAEPDLGAEERRLVAQALGKEEDRQ